MELDHEKLDVYRVSLDFAAWSYEICRSLKGLDRYTRDQLIRASQSITLNIAEACGKISPADRGRFFQIASGSARECEAILDILKRCQIQSSERLAAGKEMIVRIVAMLTRLIDYVAKVREEESAYGEGRENPGVS